MTRYAVAECDARSCERHTLPGAETLRMVRAIASTAVCEAVRLGTYRASFHGIHICARRDSVPFGVCVSMAITFGAAQYVADITFPLNSVEHPSVWPLPEHDDTMAVSVREVMMCARIRDIECWPR